MRAITQARRSVAESLGWRLGTDIEVVAALFLKSCGFKPADVEQQYRLIGYRLDFAWPAIKVAIEVDGPWHFTPDGAMSDRLRDERLRAEGWLVFRIDARVCDQDVIEDQMLRAVQVVRWEMAR